jgi:hypothetical protein
VSWTVLSGDPVDHPTTDYTEMGLTTGESWYFRYSYRNALGWSGVSPAMLT